MKNIFLKSAALAFAATGVLLPRASSAQVINEVLVSSAGADFEYIEIFGPASTSLNDLTVIAIEADGSVGTIDSLISLAGQTIPGDGFFLASTPEADAQFTVTGDIAFATNEFENGSQVILLVQGFSGADNDDLDTNDDGVLDVTPWTGIVDQVVLTDADGDTDYGFSPVVGPDTTFLPAGAARDVDGAGTFQILQFDGSTSTPGATNGTPSTVSEWTQY